MLFLSCCSCFYLRGAWCEDLFDGAIPPLEELVRVEHVIAVDRLTHFTGTRPIALDDREADLPADVARKTHDQSIGLGRDAAPA